MEREEKTERAGGVTKIKRENGTKIERENKVRI